MPLVSVIIPCYNEERTIGLLLDAVYGQTLPRSDIEVLIIDGMSTDRTREVIAAYQAAHPDLALRIIDNPRRVIPTALNLGIAASQGEYLVRLDAHAVPYPDYLARCIADLRQNLGDNVGGVWEIQPGGKGWLARAIAAAAAHPLGVGDARYRYTSQAQATDTVPFFAFHRSLISKMGLYDETLLTNEDYEFNARLRQAGGIVWLNPAIRSTYFARATLGGLARQYGRYGFWKARMLLRYPGTLRWRQALPPLFVLSLVLFLVGMVISPLAGWALLAEILLYGLVLVLASARLAWQRRDPSLQLGVPLAIAVMHLCWGAALWASLIGALVGKR